MLRVQGLGVVTRSMTEASEYVRPLLKTSVWTGGGPMSCPAGYHPVKTTAGYFCLPGGPSLPRPQVPPPPPRHATPPSVQPSYVSGIGALGQAGCPSPVWYVAGGAVAWAFFGEVIKDVLGLGTKVARHGISRVERKIPERR